MSFQGIIVIDLLGLFLLGLIVRLARTQRLHAGYSAMWFVATIMVLVLVSVPPLHRLVTRMVGAIYPASALALLAFAFVFLVLIIFSIQLSALAARQTELIQVLALRDAASRAGREGSPPAAGTAPPTE